METEKTMEAWWSQQFEALTKNQSESAFFKYMESVARDLGFEYCAYGIQMPIPISRPTTAMFNNYPDKWQRRYDECKYVEIDPTVQHALHSDKPLLWTDDVFMPTPGF